MEGTVDKIDAWMKELIWTGTAALKQQLDSGYEMDVIPWSNTYNQWMNGSAALKQQLPPDDKTGVLPWGNSHNQSEMKE